MSAGPDFNSLPMIAAGFAAGGVGAPGAVERGTNGFGTPVFRGVDAD
jgi:hypothetical protein